MARFDRLYSSTTEQAKGASAALSKQASKFPWTRLFATTSVIKRALASCFKEGITVRNTRHPHAHMPANTFSRPFKGDTRSLPLTPARGSLSLHINILAQGWKRACEAKRQQGLPKTMNWTTSATPLAASEETFKLHIASANVERLFESPQLSR